jgi:hypothetical protein
MGGASDWRQVPRPERSRAGGLASRRWLPVLAPTGKSFRIPLAKEAPVAAAGELMLLVLSRERALIGSRRLQVTQASRSCQKRRHVLVTVATATSGCVA